MAEDRVFGTEEFLGKLIGGDAGGGLAGLQARADTRWVPGAALPGGGTQTRVKVERWYPYDQPQDYTAQSELIAIFFVFRTNDLHFFKRDRTPAAANTLAWRAQRGIQFNVYGRTRPKCSELMDFVELQVPAIGYKIYDLWRVRIGRLLADGTMERSPENWFWSWYRFEISMPLAVTI